MQKFVKKVIDSLFCFVCPPFCVHCKSALSSSSSILCSPCTETLELLEVEGRCPFCFSEQSGSAPCKKCLQKKRYCDYVASALSYEGAAKSLVHELKYADRPYLAKTLSAYLLLQLHELKWPHFDLITFVPQSLTKAMQRGYNQSKLICKELALRLSSSWKPLLLKKQDTLAQAKLSQEKRELLPHDTFVLKKNAQIEDKVILLIDDVYTTGTTLDRCAEALKVGYPKRVYALTLLHAG